MILINLLPHREAARKRRRQQFQAALLLSALLGAALCGAIWLWYKARINWQQDRNTTLESEIKVLEGKIKDIATLRAEIDALKARQTSVEDLQADRNLPVHLLDELVKQMPPGTYVSQIKQEGQSVIISGVAQSQERVSELLTNMGSRSEWFSKPDLIEIKAIDQTLNGKDKHKVFGFGMKLQLVKPSDIQKAAEEKAKKAAASDAASATATQVVVTTTTMN